MNNLDTLGHAPIPGDSPVGIDIRETDQFALLQAEYAKLTNPAATEPPNAAIIIQNAALLLGAHGKDLMVAAYLTNGLMRQSGLPGLSQGLRILGDMIEIYWDTMYPSLSRLRGRRNSIQWLTDQTSKYLESTTHEPQPVALYNELKAQVKRVDELLSARDAESPPLFHLNRFLDAIPIVQEAPTSAPDGANINDVQAVAEQSNATTVDATTSQNPAIQNNGTITTPVEMQALASSSDALRALNLCNQRMVEIANVLRSEDSSNPLPYRLTRQAAWNMVNELPTHNNQQTLVPPPASQIKDMIGNAQSSQSWENLIQICENNASISIFWLDLHYLSEQSLAKLGASYDKARAEIMDHVARLLRLLPGLHLLSFNDGTPFADANTRNWISKFPSAHESSALSKHGNSNAKKSELQNALDTAANYVRDGFIGKALESVDQVINSTASAKLRLEARIRLCELMLAQQPAVDVKPFASQMITILRQHDLVNWEPEIAISVLKVAYRAFSRDSSQQALASELINQLASLSAADAYEVSNM